MKCFFHQHLKTDIFNHFPMKDEANKLQTRNLALI